MLKKFFSICLLLSSLTLNAEEIPAQIELEKFLDNTKSLSARFQQKLVDKYGYLLQQSAGSLSMHRPGKFHWDYILPYPQKIISNGKKIWMYDSELEQVNVRPYDQVLASSPVNLLDKNQKLDIEFIVQAMPEDHGQSWIKLIPKNPESDFKEMQIGLQNSAIKTMRFIDNFEQQTEIEFEQLVVNPEFEVSYFEFDAPKGTDVVGDF
ncbi:MAG: outer membrane lipoprotein carrier protein LolA [endosymbiont of Galathealinum brachiosum]|uniref:Outer-membrane lipoprotein carrier protein n=1 Tax=endosymbiont of Galathealinum brachiosum TaxID=2200906 RepID=A0A370DK73_9GAMM|nr:MAG: outer membrane lipoprotein carrier protein LolA [endosymbiont of Galathealinum brachiosum]